jgi:hypothetical protein
MVQVSAGDARQGQQTEDTTMSPIDMKIRLQDLNEAIADLEQQQIDSPDCEIVADALQAYTNKAAALEVAMIRQR